MTTHPESAAAGPVDGELAPESGSLGAELAAANARADENWNS